MNKMQSTKTNNVVRNNVNTISGAYTLPLIDKLFSARQNTSDMDDVYFALAALVDTGRIPEAFHMIRGLYGIAGLEYPNHVEEMGKSEEIMELFVAEFIFDFYDIIDERKLEN